MPFDLCDKGIYFSLYSRNTCSWTFKGNRFNNVREVFSRWIMKIFTITFISSVIIASMGAAIAASTDDPIGHFVSQEQLYQNDTLYQVRADINDDGFEDLLISSSSVDREYPKGKLVWDYYLSNGGKGYVIPDMGNSIGLALPKLGVEIVRLDEIDNRSALLVYHSANAREGTLWAYYFDGNQLKSETLGVLRLRQADGRVEDIEYYNKLIAQSSAFRTESLTMRDALSVDAFNALIAKKEPDFFDLHNFLYDPDDSSSSIVVQKATGKVVGHFKHGVFTPIQTESEATAE